MMKILICEDNEMFIETLIKKIKSIPCDEELVFESYTDIPAVYARLKNEVFDIAFLNGHVKGKNGFDLGRDIKAQYEKCMLFYVADDYSEMHETLRVGAFQLIIKSELERLDHEFLRALDQYHKIHFKVPFYTLDGKRIDLAPIEIIYIENGHQHVHVASIFGHYEGSFQDIKDVKADLVDYHFFQMHPYYYANMAHIEFIKSGELKMDNGDIIPLSSMNKAVIDEAIQTYFTR